MQKNLYQVLGIQQNATQSSIDMAFKELIEKYQALYDQGNNDASHALFNIKAAYEILSVPTKRAAYDEKLSSLQFNQNDDKLARINKITENRSYATPVNRQSPSANTELVECKTCGHEISKRAVICPHCGEQVGNDFAQMSRHLPLIFGAIGSIVLFIGVFMPIVSIPLAGNINYFQNGRGDGVIIMILSVLSIIFTFIYKFRWLWLTGSASLAVLLFSFLRFQIMLSEMKSSIDMQLSDNPFRSLADVAIQTIQLQWGWAILVIGTMFLLAGAAIRNTDKRSAIKAILIIAVALSASGVSAWLATDKKVTRDGLEPHTSSQTEYQSSESSKTIKLDKFTVNLSDGESYLQTSVMLNISTEADSTNILQHLPEIRDATIRILSSKSSSQVSNITGRSLLANEIRAAINALTNGEGSVISVSFDGFIIQE